MTTEKAIRAIIKLGDIDLDVFQFPDGSYRYSKTDIESSLGYEPTRRAYRNFLKSKDQKAIQAKDLSVGNITLKYMSKTYTLVTQKEVTLFWSFQAQNGNLLALSLLSACAEEALERRADAAFNIQRTEEERNQRFIIRRDSILSRHFWTDVIDAYIKTHDVSDTYKKFVYAHVSDYLNKALFGKTSKQIRDRYGVGDKSPRDYFPSDTLKLVDTIEKATGVRVQNNDICPKQALKDVIGMLGIEPDESRL